MLALASGAIVAGAAWALHRERTAELRASLASLESVEPFFRRGGSLVGRLSEGPGCEPVSYAGAATPLYSDRPYRTSASVIALEGHVFCRGRRHGRAFWVLEVVNASTLFALGAPEYHLEADGWTRLDLPVQVQAAGLSFDALYALPVKPGRYAVHYGHTATATPVFWNPSDAHPVTLRADDG